MARCPARLDLQRDAATLPRQEFAVRFLARMTRKAADRDYVAGMRVRCARGGWVVDLPAVKGGILSTSTDPRRVYDYARRTALWYFIRQAESLWDEARS